MVLANDIVRFIAIADAGSLAGASRVLDIPRPTLSRQLARLEERLGVRLLSRTTRRMTLTHAGAELYRRGQAIVAQVKEAEEAMRFLDGTPRGQLRLSIMPHWQKALGRFFAEYRRRYPEVELHLRVSNDIEDLIGGRSDAALRVFGMGKQAGVVVRRFRVDRGVLVASPSYLKRHGTPASLQDLTGHACILGIDPDGRPGDRFPFPGCPKLTAVMYCDDRHMMTELAAGGVGVAATAMDLCREHVEAGDLVVVVPKETVPVPMYVAYRERTFTPPAVRALVELADEVLGPL